jgi:hypothetical protein
MVIDPANPPEVLPVLKKEIESGNINFKGIINTHQYVFSCCGRMCRRRLVRLDRHELSMRSATTVKMASDVSLFLFQLNSHLLLEISLIESATAIGTMLVATPKFWQFTNTFPSSAERTVKPERRLRRTGRPLGLARVSPLRLCTRPAIPRTPSAGTCKMVTKRWCSPVIHCSLPVRTRF